MKKINIAIDGPSGSGKSTVAKLISEKYHLTYINTGLVYRAIALNAILNHIDINDEKAVALSLEENMIELHENEVVFLKGNDVSYQLRDDKVSRSASIVAAMTPVRKFAIKLQKKYATKQGIIMDGRDTTFRIMPNADLKIFLDTSPKVRAERRQIQNQELGFNNNYDQILSEIKARDHRDKNREIDPLHKVEDAHLIDASNMSIKEVVAYISNLIDKIIKEEK